MLRRLVLTNSSRLVRYLSFVHSRYSPSKTIRKHLLRLEESTKTLHRTLYVHVRNCSETPSFPNNSTFEEVCAETLDSLTDYFEELVESTDHLAGADVNYSDGVLTIQFGEPYGTYVINRQSPNEQIWLSSPTSGPKRYDYIQGAWIYRHDGISLHTLLSKEISKIVKREIDFNECSHTIREMEVMEEGNLMDRVRILLQRDMAYYQANQTVLHETLCPGVVGGLLDFPHYASFAAYKMVLWWEEEYQAAFRKPSGLLEQDSNGQEVAASDPSLERGCGGVAKTSAPKEFVQLTAESGEQILEHLHALSQEALDHADLTVLAATLGAAALLRSWLWCYHQLLVKARQEGLSLHASQKQFHSMAEALAERLLDLHCRLLSLYVLQDADSLHWENTRPFFEGERGSVTVQMWWLYMQGTRTDLWNTVPPRTAQRVFAGMLNESLTILVARYAAAEPSAARAPLLVTDLINMLLCARELAVSVCADAAELVGLTQRSKIIRDVHAKCHELLTTLLLRGCPLDALLRAMRKGLCGGPTPAATATPSGPAPWVQLVSPQYLRGRPRTYLDLEDGAAISLELAVLLAQPQPSWPLLLRVLMMRNCRVAALLLRRLICGEGDVSAPAASAAASAALGVETQQGSTECGRFLCRGDCTQNASSGVSAAQVEKALVHVIACVGGTKALASSLLPALEALATTEAAAAAASATAYIGPVVEWGGAFDRRQVWNLRRPPWMDAIITPLRPLLQATVTTIVASAQAGATTRDLLPLALTCLTQLAPCLPPWLGSTAAAIGDLLPADVHPVGGSPLLQVALAGLYEALTQAASASAATLGVHAAAAAGQLAEALCRVDEDESLRPSIQEFLHAAQEYTGTDTWDWRAVEESLPTAELLVSKILLTNDGRQALKVMYQYMQQNASWTLAAIGRAGDYIVVPPRPLLHTMFHIGNRQFDQYLAGTWSPDWSTLLQSPLGLTREKVWKQLQKRSEFSDYKSDPKQLSQHDAIVVEKMTEMFMHDEVNSVSHTVVNHNSPAKDVQKRKTSATQQVIVESTAATAVLEAEPHSEKHPENKPQTEKSKHKTNHPETPVEKKNSQPLLDGQTEKRHETKRDKLHKDDEMKRNSASTEVTPRASSETSLKNNSQTASASKAEAQQTGQKKTGKEQTSKTSRTKEKSAKE
ncbi:Frataxin-like protein, mitochondrial [Frankliniella fusca]|uniref:ferroxidase n=1 Tax=Frankliniella fusca TaxID=407009 RepID=A0AAE1I4N3_9NEOP|nr:Frataxin-like protein, mitochondrial [Frankliniella fusca]